MFGLEWGENQESALGRFRGLSPYDQTEDRLTWFLFDIAERLRGEGAFLPSAMFSTPERELDTVVLSYQDECLAASCIRFGYGFQSIGHDPDVLSDLAMTAIARAEWVELLIQMAARYGAPDTLLEAPARAGAWHLTGFALYMRPDGTPLGLKLGHDINGIVGELTALAPVQSGQGI